MAFGTAARTVGWQAVGMTTSTDRFRSLHADGIFVMPNPSTSAQRLLARWASALASTSRIRRNPRPPRLTVGRDELLDHVGALAAATVCR